MQHASLPSKSRARGTAGAYRTRLSNDRRGVSTCLLHDAFRVMLPVAGRRGGCEIERGDEAGVSLCETLVVDVMG
jgi:hypothetical protein